MKAIIWQLADDPETYGEKSGWFILTSPDGEDEYSLPFETLEEITSHARAWGWEIIELTA